MSESDFRWSKAVSLTEDDFDLQGHLNHVATFKVMTGLRSGYFQDVLDGEWHRQVQARSHTWVVGEVHLKYASEGFPHETFTGFTRAVYRSGRAVVVECQLMASEAMRLVAHAWTVQLVMRDGRLAEWPPGFLERIEAHEGRTLADYSGRTRTPFGPLASYATA